MKVKSNTRGATSGLLFVLAVASTTAWALPGEGIRLSQDTTLSPFAEVSGTYDSNVLLQQTDEQDDYFADLVAGLSLLKQSEYFMLNLRGWGKARRYLDYDEMDDETWQENFDSTIGTREKLQLSLSQRYSDVSDYEFSQSDAGARNQEGQAILRLIEGRTQRSGRKLQDYGASVGRDVGRFEVELGGSHAAVNFDNESLYDWDETQGELNLGYRVTDKTTLTGVGAYGMQSSDNDMDDPEYYKARAGVRYKPTVKTSVNVGAGFEQYNTDTVGAGNTDLEESAFNYDVAATWAVTEKIDLQAFGRNELLPTTIYVNNTMEVNQGSIGLVYDISPRFDTTLGASYRRDDFTAPVNGVDGKEELKGLQWRLVYTNTRKYLKIEGRVRYEEFESNVMEDYDQLRATLALNLTY